MKPLFTLIMLALALNALTASAQMPAAYPSRPVTLIVPFAPGGSTDIVGRIVAEAMSRQLGHPVLVDNRAGAGGAIGTKAIMTARADGYTLGLATVSTHVINPLVQPATAKYDPVRDFTLISQLVSIPNVVSIHPDLPVRTMQAFLSYAQRNPGKLNYGSPGTGSLGHMMGETFKAQAHVFITHIPYRGAGPALNDTLAGQVQVLFDNLPSSLPHIQAGKLMALAVAAPSRLPSMPGTPTFAELGLTRVNDAAWVGLIGPAKLPAAIEQRLHSAIQAALHQPEVRAKLEALLATPVGNSSLEFQGIISNQTMVTRTTIQKAKIHFD